MTELSIVWRNPKSKPGYRRRVQKYLFGTPLYAVQELISPGYPEIWVTTASFEVRLLH
jgi:hypothetical protein